ncbi:unnamed protein product [Vitrella brassicaformis CCMP3155]|uniref:Uncharacterized protein n=1 Tax=Vitrella brassicaformis (strain CCMP3155) TaxID=1169540 RepID=A0A0G4H7U2_VITBC|nr:unnamed protein product [Vitrella brassicaformis CCMP3155]|eukprot:CEM39978.1 unnamed protein product [Vitrella brassicaformis CCMP3155]
MATPTDGVVSDRSSECVELLVSRTQLEILQEYHDTIKTLVQTCHIAPPLKPDRSAPHLYWIRLRGTAESIHAAQRLCHDMCYYSFCHEQQQATYDPN